MNDYKTWHIPYLRDQITLNEALESLHRVKAEQEEIPLMVQLVENPKYSFPGFNIFHGAVDLAQHDCIHIVLGRGLLEMDEAFTIGFTMGVTKKVTTTEEVLYTLMAKYLYPDIYKLEGEASDVFKNAVRLAYISGCQPLDKFDFTPYGDTSLDKLRNILGLESELIMAYYKIEKERYSDSLASQRLLDQ